MLGAAIACAIIGAVFLLIVAWLAAHYIIGG
jgi:hypothetical protein